MDLHDIKWFFINTWKYREVLLYSRPWDYVGAEYFIREHLKQLLENIDPETSEDAPKTIKKIQHALDLLNDILTEDHPLVYENKETKELVRLNNRDMISLSDFRLGLKSTGEDLAIKYPPRYYKNISDIYSKNRTKNFYQYLGRNLHSFWG